MSTMRANSYLDSAGGNTATINGITPALASQGEAEAGTDNTKLMTPLRVSQAMQSPAFEFWQILNADYTLTSTTASQALFPASSDAVSLDVGTYQYSCFIRMTGMSATSGNFSFNFLGAGTATVSNAQSWVVGIDGGGGSADIRQWDGTVSAASIVGAGTATQAVVFINGSFRVTAAGTFIPSVALVTAAAAVVHRESYMSIRRISTSGTYNNSSTWG